MARKKKSSSSSRKKRTPPKPKSLKGLKGGLRAYWAARGVK